MGGRERIGPVRDHAVLVPTSFGPVSAVVSQPEWGQRGALVLLQGAGAPARAGIDAVWTRIARELAALGLAVVRFDFAAEGDSVAVGRGVERVHGWRRSTDLELLRELVPWFLERAGERTLYLAGSCYGARVAIEFAAADPAAIGLFLLVPYMRNREPHLLQAEEDVPPLVRAERAETLNGQAELADGLRRCLTRGPAWALVGEREAEEVAIFEGALSGAVRPFELEVVAGLAELHPVDDRAQQEAARTRLLARVAAELAEREAAREGAGG